MARQTSYIRGARGRFAGSTGGKPTAAAKNFAAKSPEKVARLKALVAARSAAIEKDRAKVQAQISKLKAAKAAKAAQAKKEQLGAKADKVRKLRAALEKKQARAKVAAEKKAGKEALAKERAAKRSAKLRAALEKKKAREQALAAKRAAKEQALKEKVQKRLAREKLRQEKRAAQLKAKEAKQASKPIELQEFQRARENYKAREGAVRDFVKADPRRDALDAYTKDEYRPINAQLRGERHDFDRANIQSRIDRLSGLLQDAHKNGLSAPGAVYRGTALDPATVARLSNAAKTGQVEKFTGFTSTSTHGDIAKNFRGKRNPDDRLVTFRIRQKSGIPLDQVSSTKGESEVLLNRGFRFRVISHRSEQFERYGKSHQVEVFDIEEH
ncbi:MAG TPA: ADP-ribosyltransferase [Jiangellaceae bacterium]|nr:ADP-ribosyltransferase [Jiangellaceae bacterium]